MIHCFASFIHLSRRPNTIARYLKHLGNLLISTRFVRAHFKKIKWTNRWRFLSWFSWEILLLKSGLWLCCYSFRCNQHNWVWYCYLVEQCKNIWKTHLALRWLALRNKSKPLSMVGSHMGSLHLYMKQYRLDGLQVQSITHLPRRV